MNFQVSPALLATTLACVMISLPASAESPARLGPEERALIEADSASVGDGLKTAAAGVKDQIEADRVRSNGANDTVREFLAQAALAGISIEDAPAPAAKDPGPSTDPVAAPNKPLEVKPGANDTLISADDGMYFDAEKGLLVYLKNVRLTGPDFDLSGANELKVFLGKKEEKKKIPAKAGEPVPAPAPAPAPEKDEKKDEKKVDKKAAAPGILGADGGFGDPEKIVATGAVKITQKAVNGKPPVVASAAILTYDAKSGQIILTGGYPWVQQGGTFMRSTVANGTLRVEKDGSFVTGVERWDMGGQLNGGGLNLGGGVKNGGGPALKDPANWETYNTQDMKVTDFRVTPDPKLPNALVLGDSLSIGYTLPLRRLLKSSYNTYRATQKSGAPVNCETSTKGVEEIDSWLGKGKWSVITFNFGHWDTNRVNGKIVTPLETYQSNLQKIVERLKQTNARLIWVTSTALRDPESQKAKDLAIYSKAAREIMERNKIEICDVYEITSGFDDEREDDAHMNSKGSKVLANEVYKAIERKP